VHWWIIISNPHDQEFRHGELEFLFWGEPVFLALWKEDFAYKLKLIWGWAWLMSVLLSQVQLPSQVVKLWRQFGVRGI
jgi:hypothetical protein